MTDPFFTPLKSHPSTWPAEVAQLRDENTDLILQAMASNGQAAEAHEALLAAEAEAEALRARVATLEAALREIAAQKHTDELSRDEWDVADFTGGYDECINTARAALKAPTQRHPQRQVGPA